MSPRLTRVELQGFKSFAQRTVFSFASGLTAVVGPNGSGKSNVSEAVRWALGEQSNLALRGRRGEDVIFAGSASRAALGMAEVSVTLDNHGAELGLAFTEVTITRRAFRDGETHYLLNGKRVRLRDLLAVTAPLGQSYTVIGQGLVDAALSARPEERRGLFEHAAGIAALRLKRAEAERQMQEAAANRQRLDDLRLELEPRLRALERAAKHAAEHDELRSSLHVMRRRLFADQWREVTAALKLADQAEGAAHAARAAAGAAVRQLTVAREQAAMATAGAAAVRREFGAREHQLDERIATLRQELAVLDTQFDAAQRRVADFLAESSTIGARLDASRTERERLVLELRQADSEAEASGGATARLEAAVDAAERRRRDAESALRSINNAIDALDVEEATRQRDHAATAARYQRLTLDHQRATSELAAARRRGAAASEQSAAVRAELEALEAARASADDGARLARERLATVLAAERDAAGALAVAERRAVEVRARLDGLRKVARSGEGLYSGVRAVLAAAQAGQLQGVVGPLSGIIEVPAALETAIEVALGGHLQDIVVERWVDAEAAIAHLKARHAGRVTFQPLDSVRAGAPGQLPPGVAQHHGVLGIAADLVRHEARFASLSRGLLGRVLVVDDLPAARHALPALGSGWSAVTVSGEIARSSGAVTGGSAVRESGVLARERALRDLPREVEAAEQERDDAARVVAGCAAEALAARTDLDARDQQAREAERALADHHHHAARYDDEAQAASRDVSGAEQRLAALDRALATVAPRLAAARAASTAFGEQRAALLARRDTLLPEVELLGTAGAAERERLTVQRVDLARALERRDGLQRQLDAAVERDAALTSEASRRAAREQTLTGDVSATSAARAAARETLTELEGERDAMTRRAAPIDAALAAREREQAGLDERLAMANTRLLELEHALGARSVEHALRRGERDLLARRVADELDLDTPELLLDVAAAEEAPLAPEERSALSARVERLATRLRRLGPPNEEVRAEHDGELARARFLAEQLHDVEQAAAALGEVLKELDQTMTGRFNATFAQVASEFEETFADLFGGGSARLVLAPAADDGSGLGGVEIVARPPGKRSQSLSLLSGGERALTAAALLFAILRVNPSPFCILDEVDAALDESNVVRFRERLKRLADRTQFVVITHNRGTIEGADTLYGITMGSDGVSRALSLRLDDALARAATGD